MIFVQLLSCHYRFGTMGSCISTAVYRSNYLLNVHTVNPLTNYGMTVAKIAHCVPLQYVEGAFFEIGVPATSLLFLFRVKAVYNHSRIITGIFSVLWLAIAGVAILIMLGITGGE